jgi:lipoprotein-anchoring transpeptidase ErfK/SrfK
MTPAGSSKQLAAGGWLNSTRIDLHLQVSVTGSKLTPEAEIEPAGTAFTGKPNAEGQPTGSSGDAVIPVRGLAAGKTYHWQARVSDATGASSGWVQYAAQGTTGPDFGIDTEAPSAPTISSPSDPRQGRWYHNRVVTVQWSSTDRLSGVQGYAILLGRGPGLVPPASLTQATGARVSNMADGIWYVAVRAQDKAGNWSRIARFRVQLDRQAPRITWLSPARISFNPYTGPASVKFETDKNASVTLRLYRVGGNSPVATFRYPHLRARSATAITWAGKGRGGQPVPRGYYFFSVRAVDHAGNLTRVNLGGIDVNPEKPVVGVGGVTLYPNGGKKIVVVLSQQTLYAYDGNHLLLKTYVTTGNPALPTPTGSYQIMAKYSPYEMISPWPPGSPYWYPPSWMSYAMLFRDGGYFLHDAPWRSVFGPGSNGPGQPGTNYGGTHGCINVPPSPMAFLFRWAVIGTSVQVVP